MHTSTRRLSLLALAAGAFAIAPDALASGLEIPDNGTVAMGRGGAFVTRASDATAVIHNVAALVGLDGVQIHLGSNFGLLNHCFTRAGTYPDENSVGIFNDGTVFQGSAYSRGGVAYPRVCNEPNVSITPGVALSYRISRRVAVGLAVWGPNTSGTPQNFADRVDIPGVGLAPSPVRYMVFEKQLLMAYLTLGASFAPLPWLRFGAAIMPAYATFTFGTMTNSAPNSTSPDSDIKIRLNAQGFLVAGQVATQILPSRYLSFGAQLRMNPEVHLRGTADVVAETYAMPASTETSQFAVTRMTVPLPWSVRAGARFSLPRAGHPINTDPHYDPMNDDVFDLEATFAWEGTGRMSDVLLETTGSVAVGGTRVPAPRSIPMNSDFRDVFGFRLGGDVNILPGRLALRAGVAYDTGAEQTRLAQIHLPGYETFSVHAGASVRFGPITANLGYAHVFMSGLTSTDGMRGLTSFAGPGPCATAAADTNAGCNINRGVYEAALDLFSVSLAAHF